MSFLGATLPLAPLQKAFSRLNMNNPGTTTTTTTPSAKIIQKWHNVTSELLTKSSSQLSAQKNIGNNLIVPR